MAETKHIRSSAKPVLSGNEPAVSWFRSSAFKCILMDILTFSIILVLFFLVCVPKKYNLSVGSISHDTINAPKDVVDEVSTQEKKKRRRRVG